MSTRCPFADRPRGRSVVPRQSRGRSCGIHLHCRGFDRHDDRRCGGRHLDDHADGGLFRHNRFTAGDPASTAISISTPLSPAIRRSPRRRAPSTSRRGRQRLDRARRRRQPARRDRRRHRRRYDRLLGVHDRDRREPRARHHRVERDAWRRPGESADHARRHGHRDGHQLQHHHPHVRHRRDRVGSAAGRRDRLSHSPGRRSA